MACANRAVRRGTHWIGPEKGEMMMRLIDNVYEWAIDHDAHWMCVVIARLYWWARGARCVFIGHKIKHGIREMYEPDYCDRCYRTEDDADIREESGAHTFPTLYAIWRERAIDAWYWIAEELRHG